MCSRAVESSKDSHAVEQLVITDWMKLRQRSLSQIVDEIVACSNLEPRLSNQERQRMIATKLMRR